MSKIDKLRNYVKRHSDNSILCYFYIRPTCRNLNIDIDDYYYYMNVLQLEGLVTRVYMTTCPYCSHVVNAIEDLSKEDDYISCTYCDHDFNQMEYLQAIYRSVISK